MIVGYNREGLGRPHERRLELLLLVRVVAREVGALQRRREHARSYVYSGARSFYSHTQELLRLSFVRRVREARYDDGV